MFKYYFLGTDPGGSNILKGLLEYSNKTKVLKVDIAYFDITDDQDYLNFKSSFTLDPRIVVIGTSTSMTKEKETIDFLVDFGSPKVFFILDDIYNVKGRLNKIEKKHKEISGIFYLSSTEKIEKVPNVQSFDIPHPLLDKFFHDGRLFKYWYDKKGPVVVIDEYKEDFVFYNEDIARKGFLFDLLDAFSIDQNLKRKLHPNYKEGIVDYDAGPVSLILGYSSFFLALAKQKNIPTLSCANQKIRSFSLNNFNIQRFKIDVDFAKLINESEEMKQIFSNHQNGCSHFFSVLKNST